MTIAEKLQSLVNVKTALKSAIQEKGVSIDDQTPFSDYPSKIQAIAAESGTGGQQIVEMDLQGTVLNTAKKVVIPEGITEIGISCFSGNVGIKEVVCPSSLRVIRNSAFQGCSALEKINLPQDLMSLGVNAFYGTNFSSITLGQNITTIANGLFCRASQLKELNFLGEITHIGSQGFMSSGLEVVDFPHVVDIGSSAFSTCFLLKQANFPNVENIGQNALTDCQGITSLNLGNRLKTVGDYFMKYSREIAEIDFGSSIETIGMNCFYSMDSLKKVTIGENIKTIGEGFASVCQQLSVIEIHATEPPEVTNNGYGIGGLFLDVYDMSVRVYVPDASVEAYKAASGWSRYEDRIFPLSAVPS